MISHQTHKIKQDMVHSKLIEEISNAVEWGNEKNIWENYNCKHLYINHAEHTSSIPAIILLIRGTILLVRSISYPRKYFAWDKAITIAEAVVKPEITEWLMKRIIHPSLEKKKGASFFFLSGITEFEMIEM